MAFYATRALRMVVTKTSTGLVGLAVDVNARANFIGMQKQILEKIKVQHYSMIVLQYENNNAAETEEPLCGNFL